MITRHPFSVSEPGVHRSLLLADFLPEDLVGVAGQDLPTDQAPSESQSTPSSARVSYCHGFAWVSGELVDDMPVRAHSVAKDVVFLGSWACNLWVTGQSFAFLMAADREIVTWQEPLVFARELISHSE